MKLTSTTKNLLLIGVSSWICWACFATTQTMGYRAKQTAKTELHKDLGTKIVVSGKTVTIDIEGCPADFCNDIEDKFLAKARIAYPQSTIVIKYSRTAFHSTDFFENTYPPQQ